MHCPWRCRRCRADCKHTNPPSEQCECKAESHDCSCDNIIENRAKERRRLIQHSAKQLCDRVVTGKYDEKHLASQRKRGEDGDTDSLPNQATGIVEKATKDGERHDYCSSGRYYDAQRKRFGERHKQVARSDSQDAVYANVHLQGEGRASRDKLFPCPAQRVADLQRDRRRAVVSVVLGPCRRFGQDPERALRRGQRRPERSGIDLPRLLNAAAEERSQTPPERRRTCRANVLQAPPVLGIDGYRIESLRGLCEPVEVTLLVLGHECSKEPVPDDEHAAVVAISWGAAGDEFRSTQGREGSQRQGSANARKLHAPVMHAVMRRGVDDVL